MIIASAEGLQNSSALARIGVRASSLIAILCGFLLVAVGLTFAAAPITQSGLNTQVGPAVTLPSGQTQYNITGGTRPGGGTNLFHSFGDFNVPTNNIANFLNESSLPTTNILGRVTGGNASSIFGIIQTTGFGTANLFLMNPAGFLFGPNATVNVGGMVAFTTADYLRFQGTDTLFNNASTPASLSPLSIAPVVAFGFLGSNPAAIAIQGSTLKVADGQSLSLVGGNQGFTATDPDTGNPIPVSGGITMTGGKLLAPGGQINIASVGGPGEISAIDYMPTPGMTMGNISLTQEALIDVSANAAGSVKIRGGQLVINQSTISADTADADGAPVAIDVNVTGSVSLSNTNLPALTARTSGAGNAGDIVISSGSLNATFGKDPFTDPFHVSLIDSDTTGSGHGGNVILTTGALTATGVPGLEGGNFILSGTGGDGRGGDVTIIAGDAQFTRMSIDTGGLTTFFGAGDAGNLKVKAQSLILDNVTWGMDSQSRAGTIDIESAGLINIRNGTILSTQSVLGNNPITIKADRIVFDNNVQILGGTAFENGGDVSITSRTVDFSNSALIITQTFGDANAGNIIIKASERVRFVDDPSLIFAPSGLYTSTNGGAGNLGNAGNVTITTPQLELIGGARINAVTFSSGQGGNINIANANSVLIAGERSNPVNVFEEPFFQGGTRASGIYTATLGSEFCTGACGKGGDINIVTGSLTLQNGGLIDNGTTSSGPGGNATVSANGQVLLSGTMLDGTPGGIFSRSTGINPDAGSGGNILVKAGSVVIQNGAQVSASSLGPGNAGSVTIEGVSSPAQSVLIDGIGSGVFTNTQGTGAGGNINVNANAVVLQNSGTLSAATSGTEASATGGTININAPNSVTMTNDAHITASSTGPGNTGNINISAGNQFAMTNSTVTTEATQSGGGAIKISTNPNGTVQLTNSTISASVLDGNGGGGSVNIDPQSVVLINSQILANAVFGPGGNIFITTNLLLPDTASVISASSQFGQQGTITVQSPISPASGKIIPLSQKPLVATTLLSQRCAALAGGDVSSFTVAGRDSLPAEPGAWLSTPLASSEPESGNTAVAEANPHTSVSETSDDMPLLSLRKIAPAGFLTQSFAVDGLAGCAS